MKSDLLISVIIPVYNVEPYLRQCVDSVRCQTYPHLQIILVDDGSPDGCGAICDEYAEKDPRVTVIHQENKGLSGARNTGLDAAAGDVIAFVDSDDWIQPDMYEKMLRMMVDKDLDVVFCGADRKENGVILEKLGRYFEDGAVVDRQEVFALCMQDRILSHCWNRLCRRHCLEKVRFPEGKIYEDIYVSPMPFAYATRPVGFLHAPLYNYRHNPRSITGNTNSRESYYIFLGRRWLLNHARQNVPELADACLGRVVSVAINACNVSLGSGDPRMTGDIAEIREFFRENRGLIRKSRAMGLDRKLLVFLFLYLKPVYGFVYRILKKGGKG